MLKSRRHSRKQRYCSLSDLFGGSGEKAAQQASGVSVANQRKALDAIATQFLNAEEGVTPFLEAGLGALPLVQQGTTVGGFDQRLNEIRNTDIFGTIADERQQAIQGQLAAGGFTRSGSALLEAGRIPTELVLQLENQLFNRQSGLAGAGQLAGQNKANIRTGLGTGQANIFRGIGETESQGILGAQQASAAGSQNLLNLAGSIGGAVIKGGGLKSLIGSFFSDPRLKEGIEDIGMINDLTLYQWNWIEDVKDTIVALCPTMGFLATEVKEKYPQFIGEFGGFETIMYPELLKHLETA